MTRTETLKIRFDRCALCAQSSDLQASHIIPSFVFHWLRDSSATGHIRFSETPNMRVQDGWKPRMLCRDCEQRFAVWEKAFAENCFVPILKEDVQQIRYRPWMLKFATSVSWRVLCAFMAIDGLLGFPEHQVASANKALNEWGRFLLDERPHPGRHEQHMFLVDVIESASVPNMPANLGRYLARAIEVYVAHTNDSVISYAKMGQFVLFGFIAMPNPRRWKGTKLNANKGIFGVQDIEIPPVIGDFMMDRARVTATKYSKISGPQHDKIRKSFERDLDRAAKSGSFRAMHHDVLLFGKEAFELTQPNKEDDSD